MGDGQVIDHEIVVQLATLVEQPNLFLLQNDAGEKFFLKFGHRQIVRVVVVNSDGLIVGQLDLEPVRLRSVAVPASSVLVLQRGV